MRRGIEVLADEPGTGRPVERKGIYPIRLKMWLHRGDPVRWSAPSGPVGSARLEDDGATLFTEVRIDREQLINGLFYGVEGMRVGGTRKLRIAPHLGYGERGVPGTVPANALLVAEITFLEDS